MVCMSLTHSRRVLCYGIIALSIASVTLEFDVLYLPALGFPAISLLLLPARQLVSTLPNIVTLFRLSLPLLHAIHPISSPAHRYAAGGAFVLLDFVDGALARRLQQATALGGFIDEEADSWGTLVASVELARQGLAPPWLALHQGFAHYLFISIEAVLCPGFEWHMPFARTAAGVMGACLVGACVAADAGAPAIGRALGCTGCAVNAISFGFSYAFMILETLRRRRAKLKMRLAEPTAGADATATEPATAPAAPRCGGSGGRAEGAPRSSR